MESALLPQVIDRCRQRGSRSHQLVLSIGAAHVGWARFESGRRGNRRLLGWERAELDPDPEKEADWLESAARALGTLVRTARLHKECVVRVPGHLTLVKRVRTPRLGEEASAGVLRFAAEQNLPGALDDLEWEALALREDEEELELLLGAGKAAMMQGIVKVVESAGLRVLRLEPPGDFEIGMSPDGEPGPDLLINIGARSSLLLFSSCWDFRSRRIGLAGNSVNFLLAERWGLSFENAEARKRAGGAETMPDPGAAAAEDSDLRAAAVAMAAALGVEIRRTLAAFAAGADTDVLKRIELTGGGALLPGLETELARELSCDVGRFDPLVGLETATPAPDHDVSVWLHDLLPPGRCDGNSAGQRVWPNLLPGKLRKARAVARRERRIFVAAGCFALLPLPVAWRSQADAATLSEQAARLQRTMIPRRATQERLRADLARLEAGERELAALQHLARVRTGWERLLDSLQSQLRTADGAWLERLEVLSSTTDDRSSSDSKLLRLGLAGFMPGNLNEDQASSALMRLLSTLGASPFVSEVRDLHFDASRPDAVRFECTLIVAAEELF